MANEAARLEAYYRTHRLALVTSSAVIAGAFIAWRQLQATRAAAQAPATVISAPQVDTAGAFQAGLQAGSGLFGGGVAAGAGAASAGFDQASALSQAALGLAGTTVSGQAAVTQTAVQQQGLVAQQALLTGAALGTGGLSLAGTALQSQGSLAASVIGSQGSVAQALAQAFGQFVSGGGGGGSAPPPYVPPPSYSPPPVYAPPPPSYYPPTTPPVVGPGPAPVDCSEVNRYRAAVATMSHNVNTYLAVKNRTPGQDAALAQDRQTLAYDQSQLAIAQSRAPGC